MESVCNNVSILLTDNVPLIPLEQREKVREFVEELVSTLVGGSIDNAPVSQLYENKGCKLNVDQSFRLWVHLCWSHLCV